VAAACLSCGSLRRSIPRQAGTPRAEGTDARIPELIGRPKGATLPGIMRVGDRQAHSVRGFLSTPARKHGLKIEAAKTEAGGFFSLVAPIIVSTPNQ
jgi:hypothetical protein